LVRQKTADFVGRALALVSRETFRNPRHPMLANLQSRLAFGNAASTFFSWPQAGKFLEDVELCLN
jgi:hypothetical protein